jgi:ABC-type amino acid transport substrate-binding protein
MAVIFLASAKRTGTLKVAIGNNAAPFGYLNDKNNLTGYCVDLATALGDRLSQELNTPVKVVRQPSYLVNRFELVAQNSVHLECGANSIVRDKEDVVFSDPFFNSGTRFLVNNNNSNRINLDSQLKRIKLGVLLGSTTEQYLRQNYPDAEIVAFDGSNGKTRGIQALDSGNIDAMVSDRVLLTGEIDRKY